MSPQGIRDYDTGGEGEVDHEVNQQKASSTEGLSVWSLDACGLLCRIPINPARYGVSRTYSFGMKKQILRSGMAVVASVIFGFGITACTSNGGSDGSGSDGGNVLPPQIVEVSDLDNGSFTITEEQPLVVNADDPTEWTGDAMDKEVAEFVAGRDDGSAVFNPGFTAVGPGTTDASMTAPDGTTYSFKLIVPDGE